jgi:hypothetical protein
LHENLLHQATSTTPQASHAGNPLDRVARRPRARRPDSAPHQRAQQDAQNIIDAPGEAFSATLYGEDTFFDDTLKQIPVTWSSAWEGGLMPFHLYR